MMKPETKQAKRRVLVCEGQSYRRNGSLELKAQLEQVFTQDEEGEIRDRLTERNMRLTL